MTALAKNTPRPSRNLGTKHVIPVGATFHIYAGSLVMLNATRYGRPAVALAGNFGVCGVAIAEADNSAGADGAISVTVQEGEFLMNAVSIAQATAQGARMFALDDDTIDETQLANQPQAGVCTEVVSATSGWMKVGMTEAIV